LILIVFLLGISGFLRILPNPCSHFHYPSPVISQPDMQFPVIRNSTSFA